MPERVVIHSSVVSTIFSRSALVSTRSGTYEPVPTMCTDLVCRFDRGLRSCELVIESFDVLDDVLVEVPFHKLRRNANSVFDRLRGARAVRLDTNTVDAQQHCAAVSVGVKLLLQCLECAPGKLAA